MPLLRERDTSIGSLQPYPPPPFQSGVFELWPKISERSCVLDTRGFRMRLLRAKKQSKNNNNRPGQREAKVKKRKKERKKKAPVDTDRPHWGPCDRATHNLERLERAKGGHPSQPSQDVWRILDRMVVFLQPLIVIVIIIPRFLPPLLDGLLRKPENAYGVHT